MKNPLKDCDCKLSDETADPLMMVNSFNTVCSHGISEPTLTLSVFDHPVQLVHIVGLVLDQWAVGDEEENHVFGYVINQGEVDEVHLWKFPGEVPQIGWDTCQTPSESGMVEVRPHQVSTVGEWAMRFVAERML